MNDLKVLNCAYSFMDNYAQHAGLSILSLFDNNIEADEINVYILDNNICEDNKTRLNSIAKQYNRNIIFIDLAQLTSKMNVETHFVGVHMESCFLPRLKRLT